MYCAQPLPLQPLNLFFPGRNLRPFGSRLVSPEKYEVRHFGLGVAHKPVEKAGKGGWVELLGRPFVLGFVVESLALDLGQVGDDHEAEEQVEEEREDAADDEPGFFVLLFLHFV